MTKYIILFLFCSPTILAAQNERTDRKENKAQIEALHVEHITTALNLTADESAIFWPMYNEYKQQYKSLKNRHLSKKKISSSLTEEEGAEILNSILVDEEKKLAIKKQLYENLSKEFSSTRLLTLMKAEHTFKKKMWDKIKRRK
jgi:hypothetical protein